MQREKLSQVDIFHRQEVYHRNIYNFIYIYSTNVLVCVRVCASHSSALQLIVYFILSLLFYDERRRFIVSQRFNAHTHARTQRTFHRPISYKPGFVHSKCLSGSISLCIHKSIWDLNGCLCLRPIYLHTFIGSLYKFSMVKWMPYQEPVQYFEWNAILSFLLFSHFGSCRCSHSMRSLNMWQVACSKDTSWVRNSRLYPIKGL